MMIRKSQSLLVSLLLHGLILAAVAVFVVPKVASVLSATPPHRYKIALARVIPGSRLDVPKPKPVLRNEPTVRKKPPEPTKPKPLPKKKRVVKAKPKAHRPVIPKPKPIEKPIKKPVEKPGPVPTKETAVAAVSHPAPKQIKKAAVPAAAAMAPAATKRQTREPLPVVQTQKEYLDQHLAKIVALLQDNLYYPRMARKRHIEGEVLVAFRLEGDGTVHDLRIKRHAREILDRAAVETVSSLSGKLPHPENPLSIEVPIRFVLH